MGGKYTKAQATATKEYMKDKHTLRVVVNKWHKKEIEEHAKAFGNGSMNAFIKRAIDETMNRDIERSKGI